MRWILFTICLLIAVDVLAGPPDNRPPDNRPPDRSSQGTNQTNVDQNVVVDTSSNSNATQDASQQNTQTVQNNVSLFGDTGGGDASAGAQSTGDSENDAGSILSPSSENTVNTTNETNFFAFSTTFPQASGCFGGMQGGGGSGGSGGGFLGFHFLNQDCWMSQLAEAEADAEVRALLKCGSRKFRDAVGFEIPKSKRQRYCVDYMENRYVSEIAFARNAVASAVEQGQLTTSPDVLLEVERIEETVEIVYENSDAIAAIQQQLSNQAASARAVAKSREKLRAELSGLLSENMDAGMVD